MQAVGGIPFTLLKNVLIFVSVSAYAGLSRSDFASRSGETRHACHVIIKWMHNLNNAAVLSISRQQLIFFKPSGYNKEWQN
jgi:hypothetical protein